MHEAIETERYAIFNADTVDVARSLPDESVDYSVFSPPFASLYTYSNSARDMGNVKNDAEFFAHFDYLVVEMARVMAPGRLVSLHCMDMPMTITRDGYIGVRDFPGDLIRAYERRGFIFHSRVTIWKDPVTAMQRTHAIGLLHKQLKKDSSLSRQGLADYIVTMRKPGVNTKPIAHTDDTFPVMRWQRYASPCWTDVDPSDTLQFREARETDDEKHICPLQLLPIRRCLALWSNPDDIVWSPFMGIGSEGYESLRAGRRFIGAELKPSYYQLAARHLATATAQTTLAFDAELPSVQPT